MDLEESRVHIEAEFFDMDVPNCEHNSVSLDAGAVHIKNCKLLKKIFLASVDGGVCTA